MWNSDLNMFWNDMPFWSEIQTSSWVSPCPATVYHVDGPCQQEDPNGKNEKLLYADDIAIKASSKVAYGETVNWWYDQLNWQRMKMNMSKTEVMWVSSSAMGKLDRDLWSETRPYWPIKYLGSWSNGRQQAWMWNTIQGGGVLELCGVTFKSYVCHQDWKPRCTEQ